MRFDLTSLLSPGSQPVSAGAGTKAESVVRERIRPMNLIQVMLA